MVETRADTAEIIPSDAVEAFVAPFGLPIAITLSPTTASSEFPNSAGFRLETFYIFNIAKSLRVSPATYSAEYIFPSLVYTLNFGEATSS